MGPSGEGTPTTKEVHSVGKLTPPQGRYKVDPGGSFALFCPSSEVPELEGWPLRKAWAPATALGGIFLHPHAAGHKAFLLLSFIPTTSNNRRGFTAEAALHTQLLTRTEPFRHEIVWFGPVSASVSWYNGRFRGLRATITRNHTPLLWSRFGPPLEEGAWLAGLLQPRSLPITHRAIDATCLQTWIHL